MIRRPPRSTLFPTRRSSDLAGPPGRVIVRPSRVVNVAPPLGGSAACSLPPSLRAVSAPRGDRKSTRLNSSHGYISYAVFCLKKKKTQTLHPRGLTPVIRTPV